MATQNEESTDSDYVISAYTRAQAVADGVQIEVTKVAEEVGIIVPVFLTQTVYQAYVAIPPGVTCQDESGRLWDVLSMLRYAIKWQKEPLPRLPFELSVRNSNDQPPQLVRLLASIGPYDIDNHRPAITIMLSGED